MRTTGSPGVAKGPDWRGPLGTGQSVPFATRGGILDHVSRLVDTVAAQLATNIKPATMRKWLERGKLTKHGHDYYGRAIVDLDEIQNITTCGSSVTLSH